MTWLTDELMLAALLVAALILVATLVALAAQRLVRHERRRRRERLDQRVRPMVLGATVCEDDELSEMLQQIHRLDGRERDRARRTVLGMLRDVTGEAATRLRAVGDATGMVPHVLAATGHRDAAARADAAEALGLMRPPGALHRLRTLAADRSPEVRTVAIRALGAFQDPLATDLIVAALALDSGVPNSVAAAALLQQGPAAGEAVRRGLADPDPGVRQGAARIAGLLQVPGTGEALARMVDDAQQSVRLAAIRSLERLPVRSAVPALLDAALADGVEAEAAAATLAAMPPAWTAAALARISADGSLAARRAAGLPRRERVA